MQPKKRNPRLEFDAGRIQEQQTVQISKLWKSSRPHPRNRAMGFKGIGAERVEELWRKP